MMISSEPLIVEKIDTLADALKPPSASPSLRASDPGTFLHFYFID